ncbi:MAG TPA: acetate kinase [Bryobacteraceae bacterium]|nr:acetate kinase [Bryobacteraceae bacterium]
MLVLVLNGGSSTLKAVMYELGAAATPLRPPEPAWDARVEWGRQPGIAEIRIRTGGDIRNKSLPIPSQEAVLRPVLESLPGRPDIAGHRVVHGGKAFRESARITQEVKREIGRLVQYAPEHNRLELEAIEAVENILGANLPQVAVFDTAFHATLAPAAYTYPGPRSWLDEGLRRYGFHGISHQYTSRRAAEILGRPVESLRMITCHLGNGASLAAVAGGRSVDTTMGFTPLAGLMMGTRSGSVDPGIVIHLVRNCGYRADELDRILNKQSGLRGLSQISGDMRDVLTAMSAGNEDALLAFDVYVHRLAQEIGSMLATLGGLDALVFTAGIGENTPLLRTRVAARFAFLGLKLDESVNQQSPADTEISAPDSAVRVVVVHTEEDWEIARECHRLNAQGLL